VVAEAHPEVVVDRIGGGEGEVQPQLARRRVGGPHQIAAAEVHGVEVVPEQPLAPVLELQVDIDPARAERQLVAGLDLAADLATNRLAVGGRLDDLLGDQPALDPGEGGRLLYVPAAPQPDHGRRQPGVGAFAADHQRGAEGEPRRRGAGEHEEDGEELAGGDL
jgi:hypothetical protein